MEELKKEETDPKIAKMIKNQAALDRLEYLIKTRNKISAIVKFK